MPSNPSRLVLKAAIGFLIGLAVWGGLSVPYTRLLASLSETVVRLGEHPTITTITPQGTLMIIERRDVPRSPTAMQFGVESTDITFNVILLMALFAAGRGALTDRNVFRFAAAAVALVLVHVGAVVSFVEAYYLEGFGKAHGGWIAQHFWGRAPYFYSVVGAYGSAIALWWLFRPSSEPSAKQHGTRRTSRAAQRLRLKAFSLSREESR